MAKKQESHLVIPPELQRISKLRERLTDSQDLQKLKEWEDKAKKSIILLSLQGHEGISMILKEAEQEIKDIATVIHNSKPTDLSPDGMAKYAHEQHALCSRKELWLWFRGLFTTAKMDLKAVQEDLDLEEETPIEEDI